MRGPESGRRRSSEAVNWSAVSGVTVPRSQSIWFRRLVRTSISGFKNDGTQSVAGEFFFGGFET
jgi:hypothetical protein